MHEHLLMHRTRFTFTHLFVRHMPASIRPPRRRTTGVETVDETAAHLAAPHQGVASDDLTDDALLALDELGGDASAVVVERMKDNGTGEYDYMARIPAAEYKNEYLKENFGGGEYRVTVIDAVKGRLNPVRVSVDKRFVGKFFANTATPVASNGVANDPFRDRLLEVLLAKALTPAPAQSNKETLELVLAVVGAMRGGGSGDVSEQVNNMINTAVTLASAMNPPEGLAGLASSALPIMEKLVTSATAPRRAAPVRALPAPAPAPNSSLVVTPPRSPEPVMPTPQTGVVAGSIAPKWLQPFAAYAKEFVKIADRGSDPTMYADLAIEEIQDDDATFAAAVDAMNGDRLTADLFALCPELEKTDKRKEFATEFVTRFREALTEILNTPDDDTDTVQNG